MTPHEQAFALISMAIQGGGYGPSHATKAATAILVQITPLLTADMQARLDAAEARERQAVDMLDRVTDYQAVIDFLSMEELNEVACVIDSYRKKGNPVNIFRKNYLPKVMIHQDTDGLWFADNGLDPHNPDYKAFHPPSGLQYYSEAKKFKTLDSLLADLYEYACAEHLKAVKEKLTYQRVQVQL